jgi:hypothetical protein
VGHGPPRIATSRGPAGGPAGRTAGCRKPPSPSGTGRGILRPRDVGPRERLVPALPAAQARLPLLATALVNTAGTSTAAPSLASDLDAVHQEMATNSFGPLAVTRTFAPVIWGKGGGDVLNVLSVLSRPHPAGLGPCAAAKDAVRSAARHHLGPPTPVGPPAFGGQEVPPGRPEGLVRKPWPQNSGGTSSTGRRRWTGSGSTRFRCSRCIGTAPKPSTPFWPVLTQGENGSLKASSASIDPKRFGFWVVGGM